MSEMSQERIDRILPEVEREVGTWPQSIPMPTEWLRVIQWALKDRRRLQELTISLAERITAQSELLSNRAEKQPLDKPLSPG